MRLKKLLVLTFCMSFVIGFSQKNSKKLKKAHAKYEEFSFVEARKLYKGVVDKGHESEEVYARLGDSYFFNSDYKNAVIWYAKLMARGTEIAAEYYLRYAISLQADDQHKESLDVMRRYFIKTGKPDEAKKWTQEAYAKAIEQQSGRYSDFGQAGASSNLSGFGAVLVPNEEAYKRAEDIKKYEKAEKARMLRISAADRQRADGQKPATGKSKKKIKEDVVGKQAENLPKYKEVIFASYKGSSGKHKWDNKPFLKLYSAEITENGTLENQKALSGAINTRYSESTPAITKDGLTMYFTRLVPYFDEEKEKRLKRNGHKDKISSKTVSEKKKEVSQLRLFQAKKKNNKWVDVQELPFPLNVAGSSSAHPALSPNDDVLYFVSNRGKKINDTDIYVVKRKPRGGFDSSAEVLGDEINTFGRETFPSVDANGILYFSSDGHPGMGGLDVFAAVKDPKGKYVVVNVGEPINSKSDDFGYVIDSESKKGYVSSDRNNEAAEDDLFRFTENKAIDFPFKLNPEYSGTVKDSVTGQPMSDVKIIVYNDVRDVVATLVTDASGNFFTDLPALRNYTFEFTEKKYQIKKVFVPGLKNLENVALPVDMFRELSVVVDGKVTDLKQGDNLAAVLKIKALYFDYGGYNIRKSTKKELDKVIELMSKRPSVSIDIKCHTDSRGRDDFNLTLSKNRAKTIVDYIVQIGGISSERVKGEGYGETEILNKCTNGVFCDEAEHDVNRRTDFMTIINEQ